MKTVMLILNLGILFISAPVFAKYDYYFGELNVLQEAIVDTSEENALKVLSEHPELFDTPVAKYAANAQTESNWTPLLMSAMYARPTLTKKLLEMGANPRFIEQRHNTSAVLILFIQNQGDTSPDVLKTLQILVNAGADLETPYDVMGRKELNPLSMAVDSFLLSSEPLRILLKGGVNPNSALDYNYRAIHRASNLRYCRYGLGNNEEGLECARHKITKLKMLVAAGADIETMTTFSVDRQPLLNMASEILSTHGSYQHYYDEFEKLALEGVKFLLGSGADVCRKVDQGIVGRAYEAVKNARNLPKSVSAIEAMALLTAQMSAQGCAPVE